MKAQDKAAAGDFAKSPTERIVSFLRAPAPDNWRYNDELRQRNHYLAAEALEPVRSARTIRVRRRKASVTDGPFAETKEVVGGFILIDAAGMDEALEIAAGIPLAKLGSIEVRPVMQMSR